MESFRINNIQVEKANAMMKHRQLRKMANLFRVVEICVILVVVSRFSSQLPLAVKTSGGYFKDLKVFLVSPRFVFILGNLIVIALFAISKQFSPQDSDGKNPEDEFYKDFVAKSEKTRKNHQYEIEYREKQSILCADKLASNRTCSSSLETKNYKRSQSERRLSCNKASYRELRRSETEMYRKKTNTDSSEEKPVKKPCPEDELSNEEFRQTIEAFIARQQKFRREEEYSIILN